MFRHTTRHQQIKHMYFLHLPFHNLWRSGIARGVVLTKSSLTCPWHEPLQGHTDHKPQATAMTAKGQPFRTGKVGCGNLGWPERVVHTAPSAPFLLRLLLPWSSPASDKPSPAPSPWGRTCRGCHFLFGHLHPLSAGGILSLKSNLTQR